MNTSVLKPILVLAFIYSSFLCKAQNFNYSLTSSTASYQELISSQSLGNNTDWNNKRFKLPIGFSFNFLGKSFDTLVIETNGFIVFDKNRDYAITAFKGMECKQDSNGVYSGLSHQLTGSGSNKVLIIQYKNSGFSGDIDNSFNYQVKLYEATNKVEIHTGTNTYSALADSSYKPLVGLINMNMSSVTVAFLAEGNPNQPIGTSIPMEGELKHLDIIPSENKLYTFTPNN